MGGTIWIESQFGNGSTFHVTFQVALASAAPRPYQFANQPHLQGKRVLLVASNPTEQHLLSVMVSHWGMICHLVATPTEAQALLANQHDFDVIVFDVDPGQRCEEIPTSIVPDPASPLLVPLMLWVCARQRNLINSQYLNQDQSAEMPIAALLIKPIRPSLLHTALTKLFQPDLNPSLPSWPDPLLLPPTPTRSLRILLAEDNTMNQKVALRLLERLGYRADVAVNGTEVLTALHQRHYDIIFMDVQMPEMDGIEATRHIRNEWPDAQQPYIVALTAHTMEGDRAWCLEVGMNDYLSKPVRIEELKHILQRMHALPGNA